jgi:hypothetical protein
MPGDDFDTFSEFLEKFKPIPGANIIRYRQGGDHLDFSVPGNVKYSALVGSFFQLGAVAWQGAAATSGSVTITFPVSFGGPPLLLVCPTATVPLFQPVSLLANPGNEYDSTIFWSCPTPLTRIEFSWLAYGHASA